MNAGTHESYDMTLEGVRLKQIWNPWYETGSRNPALTHELEVFSKEKHHSVPVDQQEGAALIFLGAGSWHALNYPHQESIPMFRDAIDNITDILQLQDLPEFGTSPMDVEDGVGNEVFIAPITPPFYNDLPRSRTDPKGLHRGEIEAMDDWLYDIEEERNIRLLRSFLQLSYNEPQTVVDRKATGFHVVDSVAEVKAQILLNLRCNAKLDKIDGYPYDRTCCADYGSGPDFTQLAILTLTVLYVIACLAFELCDVVTSAEKPRSNWLNMKIGVFAVALLYCYFADRTQIFAKGFKNFVPFEFTVLTALCLALGIFTIRKTKFRAPRVVVSDPTATATETIREDAGILSRDQTEEWKGWMQAVILVYHWTGGSQNLPIYMFVRLLVASYLFQTGYGHTIYFLAKGDFSFRRVANVMIRLNLLSCILPYIMNTDYMFYYFAPLVSFWFFIVYGTFALASKYNENTKHVLIKVVLSFVATWVVLTKTPLTEWAFAVLKTIFRIDWNLKEWEFRVSLDGFIVFAGMIAGVVQQRVKRNSAWYTNYKAAVIPSAMVIGMYAVHCMYSFSDKQSYNALHPCISFLPILAFIALRNATTPLRNIYSGAAAWLGRCSLETFILQFHIYLAADTKGVLLFDFFKGDNSLFGDRWRDLVIIVPIFIWTSHLVAEASGSIVKLVTAKPVESSYDVEDELKIMEPTSGSYTLLDGHKLGRMRQMGRRVRSSLSDLRVRVAAMLGFMWLLNWVSVCEATFV